MSAHGSRSDVNPPYQLVAQNGEINTLRGNVNRIAMRQSSVASNSCFKQNFAHVTNPPIDPIREEIAMISATEHEEIIRTTASPMTAAKIGRDRNWPLRAD